MKNQSSLRVLITGVSGNLGWTLAKTLAPVFEVIGTFFGNQVVIDGVECIGFDLRQVGSIGGLIGKLRPNTVIHLAAITDPDDCQRDPQLAYLVNRDASCEIAKASARIGARLIFASTDLVFDGSKGDYTEHDAPNPLSVYARSKVEAEKAVLSICKHAFVFRSSLIYGLGNPMRKTFFKVMLENLSQGKSVKVFRDQWRNPILVDDLAQAILTAIKREISGLYHIGGRERVSRFEFAAAVCQQFGYQKSLLVPISMDDTNLLAPRPRDSTLDCSLFMKTTGFAPRSLGEGLSYIASLLRH